VRLEGDDDQADAAFEAQACSHRPSAPTYHLLRATHCLYYCCLRTPYRPSSVSCFAKSKMSGTCVAHGRSVCVARAWRVRGACVARVRSVCVARALRCTCSLCMCMLHVHVH
jgi:hypothetical protein